MIYGNKAMPTTVTLDIALFALYTAIIFGAGWQVESWRIGSKQAVQLQKQITATNTVEAHNDAIASGFEAIARSIRQNYAQLDEKWRITHEAPHPVCLLSASDISLLVAATTESNASR